MIRRLIFSIALILAFVCFLNREAWRDDTRVAAEAVAPLLPIQGAITPLNLPKARPPDWNFHAIGMERPRALDSAVKPNDQALPLAQQYLEQHREEWQLQAYHELRPEPTQTAQGTMIRYSVYQDNIPVKNLGITIRVGADGTVNYVDNSYRPIERVNLEAMNLLPVSEIVQRGSDQVTILPEQKASALFLYVPRHGQAPEPAYTISVQDHAEEPHTGEAIVRATDGQILSQDFNQPHL